MTAKLMEAASTLLRVPKSGSTAVMPRGLWPPSRGHATSILQLSQAVYLGHISFSRMASKSVTSTLPDYVSSLFLSCQAQLLPDSKQAVGKLISYGLVICHRESSRTLSREEGGRCNTTMTVWEIP